MEGYITTTELAKRWEVSRHTIARWRKRKTNPLPSETAPGNGRTRFVLSRAEKWMKNGASQ